MPLPGVVDLFLELATIPSPSGEERAVADSVLAYLSGVGLAVDEDEAGRAIGSTAGNLLCRLPATEPGGVALFLCAHLDTVPPLDAIEPVIDAGGTIRNSNAAILGADNKAAVAVMLDAARRIVAEARPHGGVELLFTPKEEVGLLGAAAFDESRLEATTGFVYDHAAPIGYVVLGAPFQRALDVTFHGRAAHAGMYPEEGRSAVVAAARAIADLRLGRLDADTTANVGLIDGGSARNVVPERCSLALDLRSHDEAALNELVQETLDTLTFAAGVGECELEVQVRPGASGYRFRRSDLPVRLAEQALGRAGYGPELGLSGGGADANVFNERGLACLNLANGMANIHTPDEEIALADLEGMVEVTLELVQAAREVGAA